MTLYTRELEVARNAAQIAGGIISRYYREGVAVREKAAFNLVTDADIDAEKAIIDCIRRSFPSHAIMAEESHQAESNAEHLWVIDPVDGTNNFAHQLPQFAVSIAYCHNGVPQVGVVFNPVRDDWFTAVRGRGAFYNGRRVQVGTEEKLSQVLVGVGFYYDRSAKMEGTLAAIGDLFREQIHGIRRMGAASLDLCSIGMGHFGAFFEYELSAWDFAAGMVFIEEAGGTITDCLGAPLRMTKSSVLASNGPLHPAMQAIVSPRYLACLEPQRGV